MSFQFFSTLKELTSTLARWIRCRALCMVRRSTLDLLVSSSPCVFLRSGMLLAGIIFFFEVACAKGNLAIIAALLAAGADPKLLNKCDLAVSSLKLRHGSLSGLEKEILVRILQLLRPWRCSNSSPRPATHHSCLGQNGAPKQNLARSSASSIRCRPMHLIMPSNCSVVKLQLLLG